MNLFWKNLLGVLTPTTKLEKMEAKLITAMKRYVEVEKSVELEEYKKLFHIVKSAEFQENKKILQNRKYKDTEEFRITKKYKKLHHSAGIRSYHEVLESDELKQYLEFKESAEYEKMGNPKLLKESDLLQKMKAFEKSNAYKTYTRFHDSYIIKEYNELKEKVENPQFIEANEFWTNEKRWHSTPEFKLQERFYELAKNPDIVFYNNEKPERFESFCKRQLTMEEQFDWHTLDKSRWNFGFHYNSKELFENHSFANEKQANNAGKNTAVENGILKIYTRQENMTAKAWHPTKGFLMKDFHFTSDVLQTADKFTQKYGTFQAKLRCTGKIQHAFWLADDGKLPHINIFHFNGKCISIGNANNTVIDGAKITGLNPSKFHIYTLIWTEKELIWKINNIEVYRTFNNIPNVPMFLSFNSFISEKQHGSTGTLEVDWVKVYAN